jgi:DNA topoisomerase I
MEMPILDADEPGAAAKAAGLHYVRPGVDPGYFRRRSGRGFFYADEDQRRVDDAETLGRIRALAIPPAWTDVWISVDPLGHVQATGRDARERLQYRYHPRWRETRDAAKYDKLTAFCTAVPGLRRRIARDLGCRCLCRDTVAAAVVGLIERGHLRVGNDEYTRQNHSYGATTLERRHLRLRGARLLLSYRGKSGIARKVEIEDADLARVVRRIAALPGRRLFKYRDGDRVRSLTSADVNRYVRAAMGDQFSAKDFRTWAATLHCAVLLAGSDVPTSQAATKRTLNACIKDVAQQLGHTPTVCRKSYVDPRVITAFTSGMLPEHFPPPVRGAAALAADTGRRAAEKALLRFLEGDSAGGKARRDADRGAVVIALATRRKAKVRRGDPAPLAAAA